MKPNPKGRLHPFIVISMIIFCNIGIWPFGDKTIVTGDLGGQYINFYSHYARAIKNGQLAGLIYGFDKSLGGTLIGNLAYYFSSIFNIVCQINIQWL